MKRLIQVGNLAESVDSSVLQQLFEVHGAVRSALINRHMETGQSTGVGFVEMGTEEAGEAAIAALNYREHRGQTLSVCWSVASDHQPAGHHQMLGPMNMANDGVLRKPADRQ